MFLCNGRVTGGATIRNFLIVQTEGMRQVTPAGSGINNDDATGKVTDYVTDYVTDHVAGNVIGDKVAKIGDKVAKIGDKCGDNSKKWR